MDFDKPKVYGDTSITDGLVDMTKIKEHSKKICQPGGHIRLTCALLRLIRRASKMRDFWCR